MSYLHSYNINELKNSFEKLIEIDEIIINKKNIIAENLKKLKITYNSLIKHNNKKIFLFSLDSFYFQYKILHIEMENLTNFITLINNRMYGDYYKLYNIIIMQNKDKNIQLSNIPDIKKVPVYKDLEPFHEYKISDIRDIHSIILHVINELHLYYTTSQKKIQNYSDTTKVGISITNFLTTLEHENTNLAEQLSLYVNYVQFFHSSQENYLAKLYTKMDMFQREIEDDILNNNRRNELNQKNDVDSFFLLSHELIDLNSNSEFNDKTFSNIENILNDTDKLIANSEKMIETIEMSKTGKPYVDLSNDEDEEEEKEGEQKEKDGKQKDPESTNIEMIITENKPENL